MAWFGLKKLGKAVPDTTLDDDPNKQHHLPFSVVIENGDLEGVKIALENELDRGKDARDVVNARTGVMVNTPLHVACEHGYLPIVQFLLSEGASPAQEDRSGARPVHLAAANGHTKVIEALVAAGVDVTVPENTGQTAMHWAAAQGQLEAINLLILYHAPVDPVDRDGWSPLHCAARNGKAQVVERLLMRNAMLTRITKAGDSPLHLAVQAGNAATIQVLLNWKADIHEKGADGARPYEMAGSQDPVIKALFKEALITMPAPEDDNYGGHGGGGGGKMGGGAAGEHAEEGEQRHSKTSVSVPKKTARESMLAQRSMSRGAAARDSWFKPAAGNSAGGPGGAGGPPGGPIGGGVAEGEEVDSQEQSSAALPAEELDPEAEKWAEVDRDFYRWEDLVVRIKMELAASRRRGPLVVVPAAPVGSGAAAVAALQLSQQQQMLDQALKRQSGTGRGNPLTNMRASNTGTGGGGGGGGSSKRPTADRATGTGR